MLRQRHMAWQDRIRAATRTHGQKHNLIVQVHFEYSARALRGVARSSYAGWMKGRLGAAGIRVFVSRRYPFWPTAPFWAAPTRPFWKEIT